MLKTGSVLEFWPRIGLDKSFQDWILTKVHKRLSRKNSTNLCVMKWLVKSLKQVKILLEFISSNQPQILWEWVVFLFIFKNVVVGHSSIYWSLVLYAPSYLKYSTFYCFGSHWSKICQLVDKTDKSQWHGEKLKSILLETPLASCDISTQSHYFNFRGNWRVRVDRATHPSSLQQVGPTVWELHQRWNCNYDQADRGDEYSGPVVKGA